VNENSGDVDHPPPTDEDNLPPPEDDMLEPPPQDDDELPPPDDDDMPPPPTDLLDNTVKPPVAITITDYYLSDDFDTTTMPSLSTQKQTVTTSTTKPVAKKDPPPPSQLPSGSKTLLPKPPPLTTPNTRPVSMAKKGSLFPTNSEATPDSIMSKPGGSRRKSILTMANDKTKNVHEVNKNLKRMLTQNTIVLEENEDILIEENEDDIVSGKYAGDKGRSNNISGINDDDSTMHVPALSSLNTRKKSVLFSNHNNNTTTQLGTTRLPFSTPMSETLYKNDEYNIKESLLEMDNSSYDGSGFFNPPHIENSMTDDYDHGNSNIPRRSSNAYTTPQQPQIHNIISHQETMDSLWNSAYNDISPLKDDIQSVNYDDIQNYDDQQHHGYYDNDGNYIAYDNTNNYNNSETQGYYDENGNYVSYDNINYNKTDYYDQNYDNEQMNVPPPPPKQEVIQRQQSAFAIFGDDAEKNMLGAIKSGLVLRKAAPLEPKPKAARESVLDMIKDGGFVLKKTLPKEKVAPAEVSASIFICKLNCSLMIYICISSYSGMVP
jgi:hypothetical protein